jgi:hypothetical protein
VSEAARQRMERAAADLAQGGSESTLKELLKALHSADRYIRLLHLMIPCILTAACCCNSYNASMRIVMLRGVSAHCSIAGTEAGIV